MQSMIVVIVKNKFWMSSTKCLKSILIIYTLSKMIIFCL